MQTTPTPSASRPPLPLKRGEEGNLRCGRHFLSPVERGRGGREADGVGGDKRAATRIRGRIGLLGTLAVPLVVWQLAVLIFRPAPHTLPSPAEVLAALARQPGAFAWNGLVTGSQILLGSLSSATSAPK